MPGTSVDEDGDAGPFSAPAFPGHRGHFGRGKPPPPTVPPMRHSVPLACVERVRQGGGAEEKVSGGEGIEVELVEGLSGLWRTFGKCDGIQVSEKGDDGG